MEDLRRKLTAVDGSTTSLHSAVSSPLRDRRGSVTSVQNATITPGLQVTSIYDKSPPESVISNAEMPVGISSRRRQRIQLSSDGKAPPLVGSIRTNATGLLEAPSSLRPVHEDSAVSGRSSPVSQMGAMKRDKTTGRSSLGAAPISGMLFSL